MYNKFYEKNFCKKVLIGLLLLSVLIPFVPDKATPITSIVFISAHTIIGIILFVFVFNWTKKFCDTHYFVLSIVYFALVGTLAVWLFSNFTYEKISYHFVHYYKNIFTPIIEMDTGNTAGSDFLGRLFANIVFPLMMFLPTMLIVFGIYLIYNLFKSLVDKTFLIDLKESFLKIIFK